jgi:hypothetical protein
MRYARMLRLSNYREKSGRLLSILVASGRAWILDQDEGAKGARAMKKAAKRKGSAGKKAKASAGGKKKAASKKAAAPVGCCTLTGSGPDEQHEGLTQKQCRLLAIRKGKNDHWVRGKCAQPG